MSESQLFVHLFSGLWRNVWNNISDVFSFNGSSLSGKRALSGLCLTLHYFHFQPSLSWFPISWKQFKFLMRFPVLLCLKCLLPQTDGEHDSIFITQSALLHINALHGTQRWPAADFQRKSQITQFSSFDTILFVLLMDKAALLQCIHLSIMS